MNVVRKPVPDVAEQYNGTDTANLVALCDGTTYAIEHVDGTLTLMGTTVQPPMPLAPINATDWLVRAHDTNGVTVLDNATFTAAYTEATRAGA